MEPHAEALENPYDVALEHREFNPGSYFIGFFELFRDFAIAEITKMASEHGRKPTEDELDEATRIIIPAPAMILADGARIAARVGRETQSQPRMVVPHKGFWDIYEVVGVTDEGDARLMSGLTGAPLDGPWLLPHDDFAEVIIHHGGIINPCPSQ